MVAIISVYTHTHTHPQTKKTNKIKDSENEINTAQTFQDDVHIEKNFDLLS